MKSIRVTVPARPAVQITRPRIPVVGRVALAVPGPPGPAGDAGGVELVQAAPDMTWTRPHGLGRRPIAATFYDQSGAVVFPDWTADETNVYAGFRNATAGRVAVI